MVYSWICVKDFVVIGWIKIKLRSLGYLSRGDFVWSSGIPFDDFTCWDWFWAALRVLLLAPDASYLLEPITFFDPGLVWILTVLKSLLFSSIIFLHLLLNFVC
jgi:hypothetical protein